MRMDVLGSGYRYLQVSDYFENGQGALHTFGFVFISFSRSHNERMTTPTQLKRERNGYLW